MTGPVPAAARSLPIILIENRPYFADERLREYRAVDNPHDRIPMVETVPFSRRAPNTEEAQPEA